MSYNVLQSVLLSYSLLLPIFFFFQEFVSQARDCKSFVVNDMPEHYSERISQVREKLQSDPRYNENLHYPKLVRLEKKH